ncbi:D-alanyl-D-alanine carboxypeptidase/D-alanyl-D-alanine-endopeptidase (penicillin-binding protein 4) [Kribbella voronezhensis]|uniref:D-alanyl-D-alanine carboxypeptidase/D-alanyl-D-alanine-endopeptidase (Penicillin-binding protein 4) n=1 Tax=Kribbella voronezhensis TaxID=2512212 RepID=A0A4R7T4M7_9ACTN|nr:D-alanyl-D-alanine carboxypeptidase/D-alanyl-D-alanine-endopeptidase [Kribbella voronezhensis]TDU86784.1 D-alanyl-D-alanine carboxypeptidase/D-alanyl-D-alanine-endopeptidase (penicillin-binding protein 4) [Kribbella voronezhensis]
MKFLPRVSSRGLVAVAAAVAATAGLVTQSVGAPAPAAVQATPLQQQLDTLLQDPRYDGSQVGLVVRDATTGETLYDHDGGSRLLPASNTKLFSSTAAMHTLGADYRFHTDALATAQVTAGKLRGNLYLKGFGDPTSLESDYVGLAQQLAKAGIRRIDGDLIADDTYFDKVRLGDSWAWDDEPFYYSAQISALTLAPNTDYDSGTAIVESRPGATVGAPVNLTLVPANDVIKLVNTATTGAAGSANTLTIERDHGTNIVRVTGSVPAGAAVGQEWVTVWEPELYAADVFRRALTAQGIKVVGHLRTSATPATARRLARDESMTVGELMTPFLKLSNNMHAETLVKAMGAVAAASGSWSAGLDVVTDYAQSVGVDTSKIRLSDGSGLSRKVNVTAKSVTDILLAAQHEPWFQQWYDALPIAGNPNRFVGGTLRSRMANTPAANNLHGKTGSLTGVTALSGYVTTKDGRKLVFSMISNNYLSSPRSVEDAVGVLLASWTDQAAVTAIKPSLSRTAADTCGEWVKAC